MAESINSNFDPELDQLKQEFQETKSDLDAAEQNWTETRQDLLHVKENLNIIEQELIAARQNRQKYRHAYQILELFRDFWKFKEKDALLKDSSAFRERILVFLSLDATRNAVNELQLNQYEMRGNSPNLERIETRIFQRAFKAAEKGSRFLENADQEKAKLNDEKVHKAFVKITEKCLENGDPEEWSMLKEARSNLQKVRENGNKEAEDYLKMKVTALKAYMTALTLKEKLSPGMQQQLHQKLQSILPSSVNHQMSPQESQILALPSRNTQKQVAQPMQISPKSRKGRSLVHTPIKSHSSKKPADVPQLSGFGLTDLLSVGELMKLMKDPVKTTAEAPVKTHVPSTPVNSTANTQQCHKLFNNLYDQIKSQFINPTMCQKILSTSPETRERVVMSQMVSVLNKFLREKQQRNL